MDTIKLAVEELERLGNGGEPAREDCGACWNVANACKDEDFPGSPEWNRAASAWRGFSGLYSAPIPHHWGATKAYWSDLPKWSGKYGRLRREFCLHMARELRKLL